MYVFDDMIKYHIRNRYRIVRLTRSILFTRNENVKFVVWLKMRAAMNISKHYFIHVSYLFSRRMWNLSYDWRWQLQWISLRIILFTYHVCFVEECRVCDVTDKIIWQKNNSNQIFVQITDSLRAEQLQLVKWLEITS